MGASVAAAPPIPFPFGKCQAANDCGQPAVFRAGDGVHVICENHKPKDCAFAPYLGQQTKFFQRRERSLFYGGAGGGGKSLCGMMKFVQQLLLEAQRFEKARREKRVHKSHAWGIYFRRTTPDLRQAIERTRELFPLIDPSATYSEVTGCWTFPRCGNAKFQFSHMEHEKDRFKFKSREFTYIFFDELTEFTEIQYDYLDTRLRTDDPELDSYLQICSGSNPDGEGLVWVRERFVEVAPPETVVQIETKLADGREIVYDQIFIPAKLSDNPKLMASGKYEASLLNKRPEVREAILMGNWYIAPGAYLADVWSSPDHICDDHEVPDKVKIYRAGDWGIRTPSSIGWLYEDSDGCLTLFHHLRCQGLTADKVAERVKRIEQEYGLWDEETDKSRLNFTRSPLDASCFKVEGHAGAPTIAKDFMKAGIRWVPSKKGPGSRYNGNAQIVRRLSTYVAASFEGATHPTEIERPMLRAMRSAAHSWGKTMPVLRADPNHANDVDTKADDHDWDMTRYACLERPVALPSLEDLEDDDDLLGEVLTSRRGTKRLGAGPWTQT